MRTVCASLLLIATFGVPVLARAGGDAAPRKVAVAAAANLKPALAELERAFEARRPDVDVVATFGASGAFFAQLQHGAPFDLLLSADRELPLRLVAAKLATEEVVYAIGKLVVWVPRASPLDVERRGVAALSDARVRKVAIANPAVAPYGRAAESALAAAGALASVKPKLVLGQNVSQAAQFAETGAADAAVIPASLALLPELAQAGRTVPVPDGSYPQLAQSAAVVAGARGADLARAFLLFVRGDAGRAILAKHGYALP